MVNRAEEMSDDEFFDVVGNLGAGASVASNPDNGPSIQALGQQVAEDSAAKLADKYKRS
ncbi:hypothetical protein [Streptomyces sp. NRRL F-5135]|uniref:hypothetical protein n=1 Tax=Streptomyces sp. NRRL F-5135 TaxID=1463858 RepID=UPI000AE56CEF|nr:hypothetical protein [Streptomyces sp. NRRL F-5135]